MIIYNGTQTINTTTEMSRWIKVYPKEISGLSFKSIWYFRHIPHTIEAFDYGKCKIKIRKIKDEKEKTNPTRNHI